MSCPEISPPGAGQLWLMSKVIKSELDLARAHRVRRGNFRDTWGFVLTLSPSSPATLSYFFLSSQLSGILYFVCFAVVVVLFCYFVLFVCFPKTPLAIANYWPYQNLSYWHQVNLLILSRRGTLSFLCRQVEERGSLWLTHASI